MATTERRRQVPSLAEVRQQADAAVVAAILGKARQLRATTSVAVDTADLAELLECVAAVWPSLAHSVQQWPYLRSQILRLGGLDAQRLVRDADLAAMRGAAQPGAGRELTDEDRALCAEEARMKRHDDI